MTEGRIRESNGRQYGRCVRYERSEGEPPSVAAATALAQFHDENVIETSTRLYDYVDPEALDALLATAGDARRDRTASLVQFDVDGTTVRVRPDRVEVAPPVYE
ncbi:HalOD1 output domain-containing protein [Halobiforma nitratireducens]|uniref:Halobacterial output domain-containing protein n=1 Tax=Halobiforma nitratireducens JCM 10879 TaxID=1227454 RepID=M0LAG3_9EURY|nr:HalOD1 output domain-containing protein [Halobiforma nitratireducens]EMA30561.1 hypothetical protein C446_16667 [Halobiforma nitratireducens JCM 10879]